MLSGVENIPTFLHEDFMTKFIILALEPDLSYLLKTESITYFQVGLKNRLKPVLKNGKRLRLCLTNDYSTCDFRLRSTFIQPK